MLKKIKIGCFSLFLLGGILFGISIYKIVSDLKHYKYSPGEELFDAANANLAIFYDTPGFGNSPEATKMATAYSTALRKLRNDSFYGGSEWTPGDNVFLIYCRLTPTELVILCHVPDLRHYKGDNRTLLVGLAWDLAQALADKYHVPKDTTLVLGLRGAQFYGPIWEGKVGEDAITKTDELIGEPRLYPYFIDLPTARPPSPAPSGVSH